MPKGDGYAVTRRANGTIAILLWNYCDYRDDRQHGSLYDAWAAMGAPNHILPSDLAVLRQKMELNVTVERINTQEGCLEKSISIEPFGVTLLEINSVDR